MRLSERERKLALDFFCVLRLLAPLFLPPVLSNLSFHFNWHTSHKPVHLLRHRFFCPVFDLLGSLRRGLQDHLVMHARNQTCVRSALCRLSAEPGQRRPECEPFGLALGPGKVCQLSAGRAIGFRRASTPWYSVRCRHKLPLLCCMSRPSRLRDGGPGRRRTEWTAAVGAGNYGKLGSCYSTLGREILSSGGEERSNSLG